MTFWHFQSPEYQFINSYHYQFRLTTSRKRSSPEDGFRLLISANPLLRFRLVVSQDLANSGKSSSGICPILSTVNVLNSTNQPKFNHSCFLFLKAQLTDYDDWESNIFIAFHYLMLSNFLFIFEFRYVKYFLTVYFKFLLLKNVKILV